METKQNNCLNCNNPITSDTKHCSNCGQETKYRNLSIGFVMKSFFETFLNLDSRLIHSFKDIWIPNAITKSFISGKRGYYVHPFRFYFFCLIAFFGLLSLNLRHFEVGRDQTTQAIEFEQYKMLDTFRLNNVACEQPVIDSLKAKIPASIKKMDKDTFFEAQVFGTNYEDYGISTYDAYKLSDADLDEKYKLTSKFDRFVIHQVRRILKDQASVVKMGIGNMLWGILLLTALMALTLKILYIRHSSYYIEHLLHIANFHSIALLLLAFILFINLFIQKFESFGGITAIISLGSVLYFFFSLKKYYNQGFFVTLIKMIVLGFSYIFGIAFIMFIIAIFTFAIL